MRYVTLFACIIAPAALWAAQAEGPARRKTEMALIPEGTYVPFYPERGPSASPVPEAVRRAVAVRAFWIDRYPVTVAQFAKFVRQSPDWRKSRVPPLFADAQYLQSWSSDLKPGKRNPRDFPVTRVSWFAAQAYCDAQGKRLPTNDEWEYVAQDRSPNDEEIKKLTLDWYSQPGAGSIRPVGKSRPNSYGVFDLHGLIWEWTEDFNSVMVGAEARSSGARDDALFCGGGALGARDPGDYVAFMRYSFRGSLQASYTVANLGFRCAQTQEST